jgi:hypothetical protein
MATTDLPTRTAATAAAGNIHTGMEEEHPVFGCCPFSGVYCRLCQKSITTEGTTAQAMNMLKHIMSKAHLDKCCDDQSTTVTTQDKGQQSAFVALAKTKLLPIAEKLSKALKMKKNAEDARLILAPFLNPSSVSYYCRHCNRFYVKPNMHNRLAHRSDMELKPGYCPKALRPGGNNRIVVTDYDPYDFSKRGVYPKFFRKLLNEEYARQGRLVAETQGLPKAKRAKRTPQTRTGPDLTLTRGSLPIQPPFQSENSTAYVGAVPFYPVYPGYPYCTLPGNFSPVGWPPLQLPYFNVGNLNVCPPIFAAVAQPDFSVTEIQEYRSQSMQEGQDSRSAFASPSETRVACGASKASIHASEKTGMPHEPPLPGYLANMPAANKASEADMQDENEACKGDSEEGRPCTQPARSAPLEDAQLLFLLSQPSQAEEPTSVVQISSPSGASNGSPAMLTRDGIGEDIVRQEGDQADATSNTPPLVESVQDCVTQPSAPAKAPLEPSSCDPMILQESALDVDTLQQKRNDSMPICDSNVLKVVSNEEPLQGGMSLPHSRRTRSATVAMNSAAKKALHEPPLKDPAPLYIEERAYLYHDPPMPDTGICLPPLPDTPPVVIPTKTDCKWNFCEESRVLLVNFNGVDEVSPADKRAFAEMLQRDDITVVAEGLLEGIRPELLGLEFMAQTVKDHLRFRRYERDSSGEYVTYEEKKGHLSMKLSDFLKYLKQRKKALDPSRNAQTETAFSFRDRELKKVKVDVTDPLYLIDLDMPNRLPHLFAKFTQAVKIPEILPGGKWCMTNEVLCSTLVAFVCVVRSGSLSHFFCLIHTL